MRIQNAVEISFYKAYSDLKAEAARGYLGVLWWVIEPILYMGVFYIVFSVMQHQKGEDFIAFLLVGIVPWKWFASTISNGSRSISNSAGLMNQVYLPKYIFPCVVMLTNSAKFLVVLVLMLGFLVIYGIGPTSAWFALPAIVLIQFAMMLAFSGILAALTPLLPDFRQIIDNSLILLFFLSGVLFDISGVPDAIKPYLYINPMVAILEGYRSVLISGQLPPVWPLMVVAILSLVGIFAAKKLIDRYDRVYPKMVLR